jgi:hypothetical protein
MLAGPHPRSLSLGVSASLGPQARELNQYTPGSIRHLTLR